MARTKMTEEQKAQRKLEKKAEKQALRDAEWNAKKAEWARQAEESRTQILESFDPIFRAKFEKAYEYAINSSNDFFKDVAGKWLKYGKLSEKQMQVLIDATARDMKKAAVAEVIEDWFEVGKRAEIKVDVLKIEQVAVEEVYAGVTTKISMKNRSGIFFTVKTNAAKLISIFSESLEKGIQANLSATVKWHFQDSDTVILTSRGMKVELANV